MNDEKLKLCLAYFREKTVYQKLFLKMQDKYGSLGHIGGSVTMIGLDMEEKEQLGGFLQKNYRGNKTITVSAATFQQAIDDSRFAGLLLEDILTAYFGSPLVGKREQARQEEEEQNRFFEALCRKWEQSGSYGKLPDHAVSWLRQILDGRQEGYRIVMQQYREDREQLAVMLRHLFKASERLPEMRGAVEQLPVFAAEVTGNPHWFDEKTVNGRLLILYLIWKYRLVHDAGMSGAEWRSSVLFRAGILKDALSNMTLAYGVLGEDKNGIHGGMEGFCQRQEPLYLTLKTLGNLTDVWPANGIRDIYVVENPAVFSVMIQEQKDLCAVCSNGQPRLATLVLLDFLSRHGQLWYAGDFDPEGLEIAQRLKQRYQNRLTLWGYKKEYYDCYRIKEKLPKERLKKLGKIEEKGLREIRDSILEAGCAAYQERMMEVYLADLENKDCADRSDRREDTFSRREKMLKRREELLAVEEDRLAGRTGCTLDELDAYLDYDDF